MSNIKYFTRKKPHYKLIMSAAKIATEKVDRVSEEVADKFTNLLRSLNDFTINLTTKMKEIFVKMKNEMGEKPGKYIIFILICVLIMVGLPPNFHV